jgi:hypothetical protein
MPVRIKVESPGAKRIIESRRALEAVHLTALTRLHFGDVWLEPGDRFHCRKALAKVLIDDRVAERVVDTPGAT